MWTHNSSLDNFPVAKFAGEMSVRDLEATLVDTNSPFSPTAAAAAAAVDMISKYSYNSLGNQNVAVRYVRFLQHFVRRMQH